MSKDIVYEDIVEAWSKLKEKGWVSARKIEIPKTFGRLFNPSKRYQIEVGISGFGTQNSHVIPVNEFGIEDWICPRCFGYMQDITFKNKRISCKHCGLMLWTQAKE